MLFPYARTHLRSHLEQHAASPEYESLLTRLREESSRPRYKRRGRAAWVDEPAGARAGRGRDLRRMAHGPRSQVHRAQGAAGKDLGGGIPPGELVGEVFPDVPPALQRWHESGSAGGHLFLGQRAGAAASLPPLVGRRSDRPCCIGISTRTVGAKVEPDSYRRIARRVGCSVGAVLFLSDVTRELDAAREAGMQVRLSIRPGNPARARAASLRVDQSFDSLWSRSARAFSPANAALKGPR